MIEKILCVSSALIAGISISLMVDSGRWPEGVMLAAISLVLGWAWLQCDEDRIRSVHRRGTRPARTNNNGWDQGD